jgi:hypothetical protein
MLMRWSSSNDSRTDTKLIFLHVSLPRQQERSLTEWQGPLIGSKKPLSDLVTEYAQADQTYVVKTTVRTPPTAFGTSG